MIRVALALLLLTASAYADIPVSAGQHRILGYVHGINFQTTGDQAVPILATVPRYVITGVYLGNCNASISVTGGIFDGASRSGQAVIPSQMYAVTVGAANIVQAPLASGAAGHIFTASQIFLNLTVGNAAPAVCDLYIDGIDLSYF